MRQQVPDRRARRPGRLVEVEQPALARRPGPSSAVTGFVTDAQRNRCAGSPAVARTPAGPMTAAAAWSGAPVSIAREDGLERRSSPKLAPASTGATRTSVTCTRGPSADGRGLRSAGTMWDVHRRLPVDPRRPARSRPAPRLTLLTPSVATATEFPAGREGYHSYTEVAAEVAASAAAHPDIVQRFSIGKSYQGRELWAAKISDNVAVDEAEPEVLFDGGTHSDEHMGVEMTLQILHWLVDGYGTDPRITNIVNTPRDLDRLPGQPRRRRVRHLRRQVPLLAQEPPADARHDLDRHGPQPELRLPLGRRRPDEHEPGGDHLPRAERLLGARRPARCATSWPAASSTAGSRSGRRSRSTSTAGW